MRTITLVRMSSIGAAVIMMLMVIWLMLLPLRPAHSIGTGQAAAPPAAAVPVTDTRWIDLIQLGPMRRAAAAPLTINLHVTDSFVAGRAPTASAIDLVAGRAGQVAAKGHATPYPDGSSYFYFAQMSCVLPQCYSFQFQPGDLVTVTQSNASINMTVPALNGFADTPHNLVYGTAPVSQPVTTYLYRFAMPETPYTRTVTADAHGRFQADYSAMLDVRPRDSGYIAYAATANQVAYARYVAPYLRAQAYGTEVWGMAAPLSTVRLTIKHSDGALSWDYYAASASDGSFSANGDKLPAIQPGDVISANAAGQVFGMTALTVTAQIDLNNSQVRGKAVGGQAVDVLRFAGPLSGGGLTFGSGQPIEQATVTATTSGQYTASLPLQRPDFGAAVVTSPEGYQTYALFAVPYLSAWLGYAPNLWFQVTGQIDDPGAALTLTIQGPSGYPKDVRSTQAAHNGFFADSGNLALDTRDVITVTTARGVQAAMQLPKLTGQIDPVTDIVSGTAPPGTQLTVTLDNYGWVAAPARSSGGGGPSWYQPYTVIVTATAQGQFQVDLHSVIDLNNSTTGNVSVNTIEGHLATRALSISRTEGCICQPDLIYVGGNQANFRLWQSWWCGRQISTASVRLHAADGRVKSAQLLEILPGYEHVTLQFLTGTQPVNILPGDWIEVETPVFMPAPPTPMPSLTPFPAAHWATASTVMTIGIPTLTVQLNPATHLISGQAPASTTVIVTLYHAGRDKSATHEYASPVTAEGWYTVDVASDGGLSPGDVVQAYHKPATPPAFVAVAALPMVQAELYGGQVSGYLPPLTPYTISLETTRLVSASQQGRATNDGAFNIWLIPTRPGDTIVVTTPQQARRLTLPYLTAHADRTSAAIFGQAPPLAHLRVELYGYDASQDVTATASGTYRVSFPDLAPLVTSYGRLTYFDPDGDRSILTFATVHWDVTINSLCFQGIVDVANMPITLTLRTPGGSLKSTRVVTPTYSQYTGCFSVPIQSGDRIDLQTASATEVFTVPFLTARHNYPLQAVEGTAPPNHELFAEFWWAGSGTRRTFSDGGGHYGIDASDLRPLVLSQGRVFLHDEAGNTTSAYFTVTGYQTFLPLVRR